MTRPSLTWGILALAGLSAAVWLGASHRSAQAAPAGETANGIGTIDPSMTTLGAATTAVSDGQGNVVLSYPNGVIAVFKPANLESVNAVGPNSPAAMMRAPIAVYRLHTNGMSERLSILPPPMGH
jgi:hypothetical protein